MDKQDFLDVAEVTESDQTHDVNLLLSAGWRLLNTYTSGAGSPGECTVYALGWPRSAGPVVNPVQEQAQERRKRDTEALEAAYSRPGSVAPKDDDQ